VTDGLSLRHATLDDLSTIVELRLALLREYSDHAIYGRLRTDVSERAFDLYRTQILSPLETLILAERNGAVVGVLRCVDVVASPLLLPERYCYVSSVFVVPAERRRGVLRALMRAAESWCADRGLAEMRLHNSASNAAAQGAWQSLGFEVVEEVRHRVMAQAR
jgi:ribosomal protein S18 acetylase RimI-like enzyme